jgi:hypothetical protein
VTSSRYYSGVFTEGLRKTAKISVGIGGVRGEIRTEHLLNLGRDNG